MSSTGIWNAKAVMTADSPRNSQTDTLLRQTSSDLLADVMKNRVLSVKFAANIFGAGGTGFINSVIG
jgi:hypothetical protein